MNKKDFLKQYLSSEYLKKDLKDEILKLDSQTKKVTANYSIIQGGCNSLKDDAYVDLILKKEKYQNEILKIQKLQQSIESAVFGLSDGNEKRILILRYFKGLPWVQISTKLNMSERNLRRIHNNSLGKI